MTLPQDLPIPHYFRCHHHPLPPIPSRGAQVAMLVSLRYAISQVCAQTSQDRTHGCLSTPSKAYPPASSILLPPTPFLLPPTPQATCALPIPIPLPLTPSIPRVPFPVPSPSPAHPSVPPLPPNPLASAFRNPRCVNPACLAVRAILENQSLGNGCRG